MRQVRQAITNILQNAIDSIHKKQKNQDDVDGKIDILIHTHHQNHYIIVTDNGAGLPKDEDPASLSEPYVTHRAKGTGLGLAIVKKIMTDHNGKLMIGENKFIKDIPEWKSLGGATIVLMFPDKSA